MEVAEELSSSLISAEDFFPVWGLMLPNPAMDNDLYLKHTGVVANNTAREECT